MYESTYLLLVETSAIIETDPNTWQAIAKLGECLLPEIVAIEIKNIADGKVADGNDSAAKEFRSLLPKLNWQITPLIAKHPDLLIRTTQNLSRKTKLMMNVAQGAVGVANAHPQKCVVLISNEISLRDRIAKLGYKNLCAIPSAIARQWSRTDQAPPIVQQLIKQLQEQAEQTVLQSSLQPAINLKPAINTENSKFSHLDANIQISNSNHRQTAINLVKFGLTTIFLATILLFGWRLAQPQQFQQFWGKTGLPSLPKILIDSHQPNKNQ